MKIANLLPETVCLMNYTFHFFLDKLPRVITLSFRLTTLIQYAANRLQECRNEMLKERKMLREIDGPHLLMIVMKMLYPNLKNKASQN